MLTLRTLETSGGKPYQYDVIGLPTGRGAMLARLSGVWKVLKIERVRVMPGAGALSALMMRSRHFGTM